jgi:hypothetical protein
MLREIIDTIEPERDGSPFELAVQMLDAHRRTLMALADKARRRNPASEESRKAEWALRLFDAKWDMWAGST